MWHAITCGPYETILSEKNGQRTFQKHIVLCADKVTLVSKYSLVYHVLANYEQSN
jgi:hypothetical protein